MKCSTLNIKSVKLFPPKKSVKLIFVLLEIRGFKYVEPATVEPRFNEPLYNKVLGKMNDFLYLNNSQKYE